ncbi:hypothetical protein FIBSPDRAFT_849273 [Athelia psychrophila]|uniref:Uncharacterized protein n=1 Tax=Athelia psychrophila TaxID=1759441 RepID=A0A166UK52_9AGAM|nr:hypothetical protein FIBSPDRAFT_849273 [Fibularhizoctonia sp. CBS 109695]
MPPGVPPWQLSSQTTICPLAVLPLLAPLPMAPSHLQLSFWGDLLRRFCGLCAILGPLFRFVGGLCGFADGFAGGWVSLGTGEYTVSSTFYPQQHSSLFIYLP